MRRLVALALTILAVLAPSAAYCQDVGYYVRPNTTSLSSPVAGQTIVFDSVKQQFFVYDGSAWRQITTGRMNLNATTDPGVSDDSSAGFSASSLWVNISTKEVFLCSDASVGSAVWTSISKRLGPSDGALKLTTADIISDFKVSGFDSSVSPSTLTQTTPSGTAYVSGKRISVPSSTYNYPASKDIYDYLQADCTYNHIAVNNGDLAPTGQPGMLMQKVVTGASATISITAIASSLPHILTDIAVSSSQAISLGQADSTYSPISLNSFLTSSKTEAYYFRAPDGNGTPIFGPILIGHLPVITTAKGGLGAVRSGTWDCLLVGNNGNYGEIVAPPGALKKLRTKSSFTGTSGPSDFEWVDDVNGTVTTMSVAVPTDAFTVNVSNPTSTPSITIGYKSSGATTNQVIRSDNSGAVALGGLTSSHLPTVPLTKGGTGNASLVSTIGTLITGDGTQLINTPTMSPLQSVRLNAAGTAMEAFTPSAGSAPGFGGDAHSSTVTKGAVTETTVMQINASTITQTVSTTYVPKSGSVFKSTGSQSWNGTTNVASSFTAPIGVSGLDGGEGGGPCRGKGGQASTSANTGGGGGGGGGNGGAGARGADDGTYVFAGRDGGGAAEMPSLAGSAGGTGGSSPSGGLGGTGGTGGGVFIAECVGAFTIGSGASINCNGGAGSNGTYSGSGVGGGGGGGGGAGGTVQILAQGTFTKTGNVNANGGNGGSSSASGTSAGKGGAGGGGRIIVMAPTITGAGSLTANAGSNASTGDATNLGTAGAGVVVSISDTPTGRFALELRKSPVAIDTMYALKCFQGAVVPGSELHLTEGRQAFQWQAAFNARNNREFARLCQEYQFGALLDGTCQIDRLDDNCDIGQEALNNAA